MNYKIIVVLCGIKNHRYYIVQSLITLFSEGRLWQDTSVIQQIVTTAKTNMISQTKDARSVSVRHTRKDLFGTNAAEHMTFF
jgi:hypothetical protein